MKCKEINLIEYIDGIGGPENRTHIQTCQKCQNELKKLSNFFNLVSQHYKEGKKFEGEIENELENIDPARMNPLPRTIKNRITQIRDNNLISRVKKVIGKGNKNADESVNNFLSPQLEAMPASPKDIIKTKKERKKKGEVNREPRKSD